MERGLYIAASGMLAELVRQDQIANDLANAATPGYKPDRAVQRSFAELLLTNQSTGQPIGALGAGATIDAVVTDLSPGGIRETSEPLDFAIEGDGFFGVNTPQGVRYTRNGQFGVSTRGTLVTSTGAEVIGANGGPVRVGPGGEIDPATIGMFALTGATKVGDNLFTGQAAGNAAGRVRQGALESSAVDPARSMVELIASFRSFEAGQRVIRTIDETLQKAANEVGSQR